jgi:hypothetical protein
MRNLKDELEKRFAACGLELHPGKTRIVYCKDDDRRGRYPHEKFDFLGYSFPARRSKNRWGQFFVTFSPGISDAATKAIREEIRDWRLRCRADKWIDDLARMFNPIIRGWINYYGRYYKSALYPTLRHLDRRLAHWAMAKYKRLRRHRRRAEHWAREVASRDPALFAHWPLLHRHRLDGKSRMSGDVQVRIRERLGVRLPRATRLVILIHAHPRHGWLLKAVDKRLREELAKLHVQINEQKSRTVNLARGESFGFLGFDFRRVRNLAGRWRPQYAPKLKKRTALLQTLREIFRRHRSQPVQWVVEQINPILRGWVNYFAIGYSSRCFQFVKRWVEIKVRRHLMRARKCRGLGWERWSTQWLHANLGLFTGYRLRRDLRKVTSVA